MTLHHPLRLVFLVAYSAANCRLNKGRDFCPLSPLLAPQHVALCQANSKPSINSSLLMAPERLLGNRAQATPRLAPGTGPQAPALCWASSPGLILPEFILPSSLPSLTEAASISTDSHRPQTSPDRQIPLIRAPQPMTYGMNILGECLGGDVFWLLNRPLINALPGLLLKQCQAHLGGIRGLTRERDETLSHLG